MEKEMNKKGQQITLTTLILIVLGIIVLVFLVFGFSTGWSNLWDRVINLGGGSSNVATINQACTIACSANNQFDFCSLEREVKGVSGISDEDDSGRTCNELVNNEAFDIDACPSLC